MIDSTLESAAGPSSSAENLTHPPEHLHSSDEPFAAVYLRCKALIRESPQAVLPLFGFTSSRSGEGVSTFAGSVAAAAAANGERRVLLVDGNGDHPALSSLFGADLDVGLAEHVQSTGGATPTIGRASPTFPNLSVLGFGQPFAGSASVFESHRLPTFIRLLPLHFSFIVFDLPAVQQSKAALRLAALLTGVVLVVESERTPWQAVKQTLDCLERSKSNVIGAVLNKRRTYLPDWLYKKL